MAAPDPKNGAAEAPEKAPAPGAPAGGLKPWLPVLANLLLIPALTYATVHFLILPKMHLANARAAQPAGAEAGEPHEGKEADAKVTVPLGGKVLVNVAGTMGTRYLLASLILVGNSPTLKDAVTANDAQLRDAAAGVLSVKTITDLEKPAARNLVRAELISVFNNVLGENRVKDIYLTEFAIQ